MQEPGGDEDRKSSNDNSRHRTPPALQRDRRGEIDDLHHEILPVDARAPPEVGEPRSQKKESMRRREIESKQAKESDHQVKLTDYAEVDEIAGYHEPKHSAQTLHLLRRNDDVVIDETVGDEVREP